MQILNRLPSAFCGLEIEALLTGLDCVQSTVPGVTNNPAAAAVSQLLGTNPFGALNQGSCTKVCLCVMSGSLTSDLPFGRCSCSYLVLIYH